MAYIGAEDHLTSLNPVHGNVIGLWLVFQQARVLSAASKFHGRSMSIMKQASKQTLPDSTMPDSMASMQDLADIPAKQKAWQVAHDKFPARLPPGGLEVNIRATLL